MIGEESFISVFRQGFQLLAVSNLSLTKDDIDNIPPFERYAYFDLVKEYNEEINKNEEK